jgi:membrane-associated progesterone receptor component
MAGIEEDIMARLPDDMETGEKLTLSDLATILQEKLKGDYQILVDKGFFTTHSVQEILEIVQSGNLAAILVIIAMSIMVLIVLKLLLKSQEGRRENEKSTEPQKEEEKIIPRDFTIEQLREFDGKSNEKIFIALKGEVYDVTNAADYYGPEGTYNCFAGRDCSRAMAKLSFEEAELGNPRIDDLGPFERDVLEQWVEKFKYVKHYPVVGKISNPKRDRVFTRSELKNYKGVRPSVESTADGTNTADQSTSDRVDPEILLAVKGNVYDVSYGGTEHYGPGGSYHLFAGIDASRALAKMSFEAEDVNSSDLSDLSEEHLKILDDWEEKFQKKRMYPLVGRLVMEGSPAVEVLAGTASPNSAASRNEKPKQ